MPTKTLAFLSMDDLSGYVFDDDLAIPHLNALGWTVETISWESQSTDWSQYDAVIIRTTWNYQQNLPAFLDKLSLISSQTRLLNPLDTVRWNADKSYLRELIAKGATPIPTLWGSNISSESEIEAMFAQLGTTEIVIKPTVSANAEATFRLSLNSPLIPEAVAAFSNREFLAQPFLNQVTEEGEYSLFYFNGAFSHAILKTPKSGDFRVQEEHGGIIQAVTPTQKLLSEGAKIIEVIGHDLLYARVDFVQIEPGIYAVMEVELIEPALYLRMDPSAPEQFSLAIHNRLCKTS
jgi:glutathione synthase/RimK-type ligase-like ATP-grasp enzyme